MTQRRMGIYVEPGLAPYVERAVEDLESDWFRIHGVRPERLTGKRAADCVSIGKRGDGWERYAVRHTGETSLEITGSDDRGVQFGIYAHIRENLGVDPFEYWTGTAPKPRPNEVDSSSGEPSFRFRGWFINDEDLLCGFQPGGHRKIDYPFYQRVIHRDLIRTIAETAVRAGFNLIIPESFVDILNPDEKMLLDECAARGLFLSMHHIEPMGVSAFAFQNYWRARGQTPAYSYFSEPEALKTVWRAYARRWAEYPDVVWQIGLRGIGDRPLWLADPKIPNSDAVYGELISAALQVQLEIISEVLGHTPEFVTTTLWAEGSELCRKGLLKIPAGVIPVFSDNCAGWRMQRDCRETVPEKTRRYGVYYHHAIMVGTHLCPAVPPALTHRIFLDLEQRNIREYVLFNVANIREFVMGLAAGAELTRDVRNFRADEFLERWVHAHFEHGCDAVENAFNLYFNAFELHPETGVALFNDGLIARRIGLTLQRLSQPGTATPTPPAREKSRYLDDEYAFAPELGTDAFWQSLRDMFPDLRSTRRSIQLLAAQTAGFERCLLEIENVPECEMDAPERDRLYDRLIFPATFMFRISRAGMNALLLQEAWNAGNRAAARRFLGRISEDVAAVFPLMDRYCHGKWARWLDNCKKLDWQGLQRQIADCVESLRTD